MRLRECVIGTEMAWLGIGEKSQRQYLMVLDAVGTAGASLAVPVHKAVSVETA